jgi:hypothetical protein
MLTYAKYDILKSILKFEIQIKIAFHFYIQLGFLTKAKIRHFGGTVCPRERF